MKNKDRIRELEHELDKSRTEICDLYIQLGRTRLERDALLARVLRLQENARRLGKYMGKECGRK